MHPGPVSRVVLASSLVVGVSLWLCATSSAQTDTKRSVLTIHWGDETFPVNPVMDAAIREVLVKHTNPPVAYYTEYLESDFIRPKNAELALRDYIRQKYEGLHFDVVIANTTPSLRFALQYRDELFPGTPIVFNSTFIPEAMLNQTFPGATGILSQAAFAETLELALTLHPSTRQVFVVAQAPGGGGEYEKRLKQELGPFARQVKLTYIGGKSIRELLAELRTIPPRSIVFYTRYTPFDAPSVIYTDEVARLMVQVSPAPIYSATDQYMGTGVVGGMVRGGRATGTRLGEIARQILEGARPDDIPITGVQLVPTFDWRQLQRWHIDPARLPAGSEVLFRTPTMWESYREHVIGALIIVLAQLMLIAALLAQRARRRRAEETIVAREATLRRSYDRIRQLAGRLIHAQDEARASIARDLHDDVCQRLVCINMTVTGLRHSTACIHDKDTQLALADLEQETNGMFDGIRRLSHELHPATLPVLGVAPTLKSYCSETAKRHNVEVNFSTQGEFRQLRPDVSVGLFRIAQEALRNAIVHGSARHLEVSLVRTGEDVELTIADDGCGFDLEAVRRDGNGLGVVSMEERAYAVGGDIQVVTAPEQGTTIRVRCLAERRRTAPEPGSSPDMPPKSRRRTHQPFAVKQSRLRDPAHSRTS